ncbi:uncharacterized protein BJ212DRAFT_1302439 [Suillus subaureus]|uniref:Fungal-type protein kinase domain-containing protein n=1 Tax=Suillus subaureus TaxID=48587 RepID=A0A9P7E2R8_9AGAM|nr:uncharacterized protein BJ212DRAFT_1302439 [Suillus subaureus]KAG1809587.1 hypothetical protein BJ212DRAFT_1302439 [Suillus subaureus]
MGHQDDLMFCNRFHCYILLSPCGQPLSKFSSRRELLTAFHAFVVTHQMMIERRVFHGDLSPNNFVVHDSIGSFIDFDHALILVEGMTSTYSHGTGTMPYISICILQAMLDLAPSEVNTNIPGQDTDLNDLDDFKVDNNIGLVPQAANTLAANTPQNQTFPWASAYEAFGKVDTHLALSMICFVKMGVLMQGRFFIDKTSEYFTEFRPLVQKWGTMVYGANGPQDQVEMTYTGVLNLLNTFMRSIGKEPPPLG